MDRGLEKMSHLKIGTRVKITGYDSNINGETGAVFARDGEYYKILMDCFVLDFLYDIYRCELEELV